MIVIVLSEHAPKVSKEVGAKCQHIAETGVSLERCKALRRVRRMA